MTGTHHFIIEILAVLIILSLSIPSFNKKGAKKMLEFTYYIIIINKVDVQNNILHTLGKASRGGEKAYFYFSFPPPSPLSLLGF